MTYNITYMKLLDQPKPRRGIVHVDDFIRPHQSHSDGINRAIQALRYNDGACGGALLFGYGSRRVYHIDAPLVLDVHNVAFQGTAGVGVWSEDSDHCVLRAEHDGPIFEVPHESPCKVGGLHFEGLQLDGNSGGENQYGILINTGDKYRSWFTFDRCSMRRFDAAVCVNNSSSKPCKAIGQLLFRWCNITGNGQGFVGTNGGRVHLMSVRDGAVRRCNRDGEHEAANRLPGECIVWDNVNLEGSHNAILYEGSSQIDMRVHWTERLTGEYAMRFVGCHGVDVGRQRRYKNAMTSPIQLHKCHDYDVRCEACVTGGGDG